MQHHRVWRLSFIASFAYVASAMSCSDEPTPVKLPSIAALGCEPQHAATPVTELPSRTTVAGALPVSFSVDASGGAALAMTLDAIPSRGFDPDVRISYSSNNGPGVLGTGFSVSSASSITRCPKTMALDDALESPHYDESDFDSLCLDGQRMVVVGKTGSTIEYRLIPDANVKVIGHFEEPGTSYLEAYLPTGEVILYGKTAETRPMAHEGQPRAWLATEKRDPRGNTTTYGYCFAKNADGSVAEYALDQLAYTSFENDAPTRSISFVYGVKDDPQFGYAHGIATQQSLRLDAVHILFEGQTVRRYGFAYEQGETTGRTRLSSVEACAASGECLPPTKFYYEKAEHGFEPVATNIEVPTSLRASPMFADMNGDGLSDWFVPDITAGATEANPITEWRLARNTGDGFASPQVAFLQEWSVQQNPEPLADSRWIRPELGTVLQYNADEDQRADILVHDIYNNRPNYLVLQSKPDGSFEEIDTGIARPFPTGPAPAHLRGTSGATHLLDADGDSIQDLLSCDDHGSTPETAALPTWTLHLWKPGGWEKQGTVINKLQGYPCELELFTLDTDHNGTTDVLIPGMIAQGGVPSERAPTYYVFQRSTDGAWQSSDTNLKIAQGRLVFGDFDADGLPDALTGEPSGRLVTYLNTGKGFSETPENSLPWDLLASQTKYLFLAGVADFDQNGQSDILMPLLDADHPNVPQWVILRATGGKNGFTFERLDAGIPFEPALNEAITLADPHGPRIGDVNGDGAPDIAIYLGNQLQLFVNRVKNPDTVIGFSDGMTERDPEDPAFVPNVSFTYNHLTDPSVYVAQEDPANGCVYPRHCAVGGKRVVSEYRVNDGQGGQRAYKLQYRDGRYDRVLGQWLGFGKRIVSDVETGQTTIEFFDNVTKVNIGEREVYPLLGQMVKQWAWTPDGDRVEMSFTDRTIDVVPTNNEQTYFTLATHTHTRRMQGTHADPSTLEAYVGLVDTLENATMLSDTSVEVLDVDEFRNVLEVKASTEGLDASTHVTRTVKNDVGKWMLGLPDTQTECSTGAGLTSCRTITRTTNEFGEVITESTSSNDAIDDTKLFVKYDRDKFGNVTKTSAEDAFGHHRESMTVYDGDGVFPVKQVNALGHGTLLEYDQALGVLTKETDPNGLVTEWKTDGFGRLVSELRSDGSSTTITRTREKVAGLWRTRQRTTTTGGADDDVVFDSLGRTILALGHGPAPTANTPRIMQKLEYDRLTGNVARKSVPIAEGTPETALKFEEYEFDPLGREIRHTTPWGAVNTTSYDGLTVDSADLTQTPALRTVTNLDASGRPQTITDAKGGLTKYVYGPFNALRSITDPGNDVTTWTRDAFGRVRTLDQPDRGTTTFVYDGFGDLVSSTDALGRTATWEFDTLGRTTKRIDVYAGKTLTTSWTWDTAPHGIGVLHMLTSPDAIKTYSYTQRGQLEKELLSVAGDSFASTLGYDEFGRIARVDYPQPLGQEPFGVTREYDAHGFVVGVRDANGSDSYWQLTGVDQAGRYKEESLGNQTKTTRSYFDDKQALKSITTTLNGSTIQQLSYGWDERLNLKSRTDTSQATNKTEWFRHDELDRLTCAYFAAAENPGATCATAYGYAPNGNLKSKSDIGILSYTDPNHPHAVTNAPGSVFTYDAVGNQIGRPGGVTITYTAFDLPETIKKNGKTTSLGYDGDQQRIRKTAGNTETLYVDDLFEQVTAGNAKEFRYYVHSPERVIAVVTRGSANAGTNYLHADHLGSVESVTNANGEVVEKRSYDAFGAKRNPQWGMSGGLTLGLVAKGFTGHEEEDEFGLVNMKGRLYDPKMGRFTTTDPVISNVWDGQTLNPFSYVMNNPLAFVDPTGFVDQPILEVLPKDDMIEQTVKVDYPDDFVPDPLPEEIRESTSSMRFTTDVGTTGDGGEGLAEDTTESGTTDFRDNTIFQLSGSYLFGVGEGLVPFAAFGHSVGDNLGLIGERSDNVKFGLAIGQIVGGVIATLGGLGGELLGGAATVSGVGAAVGVPVMVVSAAAVTGGVANIAAGIRGLASVMSGGGPPTSKGGGITRSEHAVLRNSQGRPVPQAAQDLARARQGDVFVQNNGRFVIRGPKGREHIIEPGGTHITSLVRSNSAHQQRLQDRIIRYSTQEEFQQAQGLLK